MRDALDILINKIAKVISNLQAFSLKWKGGVLLSSSLLSEQTLQDIVH